MDISKQMKEDAEFLGFDFQKLEFDGEYYSALLYDKEQDISFWIDMSYDSYGDFYFEWNQYIFYDFNSADQELKAYQEQIENWRKVDEFVSYFADNL